MNDWRDPIIFSILSGIIGFVISVIILSLSRPQKVMKVRNDHTYGLDWFNLIMISLITGIIVAIGSFLLKVRNQPIVLQEPVKMEFSTTY